jgi:hypothetical protein
MIYYEEGSRYISNFFQFYGEMVLKHLAWFLRIGSKPDSPESPAEFFELEPSH